MPLAHTYTPYSPSSSIYLPTLRGIPLDPSQTDYTYSDSDGVKWWADTWEYGNWEVEPSVWKWCWKYTERIKKRILNADDIYSYVNNYINIKYIRTLKTTDDIGAGNQSNYPKLSNKFIAYRHQTSYDDAIHIGKMITAGVQIYFFGFDKSLTDDQCRDFFIGTEYYYQLATPVITYHDDPPLKSYPRYTHVEQITDGVRANMQLMAKVVDGI